MKKTISRLLCVICAIGTYIMAFMAADIIKRGIPFDFISGLAIIICNAAILYLFIMCCSELTDPKQPEVRRKKCSAKYTDYFDSYFDDKE